MSDLSDLNVAGVPIFGSGAFPFNSPGKHFWVDYVHGSDSNPGTSYELAKKTISAGYALCTTNRNDVLHVVGGASAYAESAVLTFDKDYTHVVGHVTPGYTGGRVRITNSVTTATAGEFVISGTGCTFVNLHFQWGASATATSLIGIAISGNGRNAFVGCNFEGPIDATIGAAAGQRLMTITSSQDNYFYRCGFGQRSILNTAATGAVVALNGTNVTDNVFEECIFHLYNSNTASCTFHVANGAVPASGSNVCRRCTFFNHTTAAIADQIRNTTNAAGIFLLDDSKLVSLGTAVWATNLKTSIFCTGAASANNGGVAIVVT